MEIKKLAVSVGLAVAALGSVGAAQAVPMLQITQAVAGNTGGPGLTNPPPPGAIAAPGPGGSWSNVGALAGAANQENIGDPGGTLYTNGPTAGASAGPGMPTINGGWPADPNMGVDMGSPPGAGNTGISGWDASYLNLTQASNVTFQFTGKGNASNHNQFWVYTGAAWTMLWDNQSNSNGTCGTNGTSLNCPFAGSEQTYFFDAGLVPFLFADLSNGQNAVNDGANNPSPDQTGLGGYFLGCDPYMISGSYPPAQNTCNAVYAGFTDGGVPGRPGDHDYEDLSVRVTVPEPGSLFLLGAGLLGFAGVRRRKA